MPADSVLTKQRHTSRLASVAASMRSEEATGGGFGPGGSSDEDNSAAGFSGGPSPSGALIPALESLGGPLGGLRTPRRSGDDADVYASSGAGSGSDGLTCVSNMANAKRRDEAQVQALAQTQQFSFWEWIEQVLVLLASSTKGKRSSSVVSDLWRKGHAIDTFADVSSRASLTEH